MRESQPKQIALISSSLSIVVLILIYFPTFRSISDAWLDNGAYSHGYLAFLLSLYLAWGNRGKISSQVRVGWLGLPLIFCLSVAEWLASLANVQSASQLFVFGMAVSIFVIFFGYQFVRVMFTPVLINLLVLPVWSFLQGPLQDLSSNIAHVVLKLLGIPTLREGHHFSVPGGQFIVEEACSGLGFFLCANILGVFYARMNNLSKLNTVLTVLTAAGIALIANWIRIIIIMVVGNYTKMDHFIVDDHLTFGWIVFSIALVPLFMINSYLFPARPPCSTAEVELANARGGQSKPVSPVIVLLLMILVLVIVPVVGSNFVREVNSENFSIELELSEFEFGKLKNSPIKTARWAHRYPKFDSLIERTYRLDSSGAAVNLFIGTYFEQSQGRELININNRLYGERWTSIKQQTLAVGDGSTDVEVLMDVIRSRGGAGKTIFWWYVIGDVVTISKREAKLCEIFAKFAGLPSSVVVMVIDERVDQGEMAEIVYEVYKHAHVLHARKR